MNNLFLTGRIQVGKTTLLNKWLDGIDVPVGGFITRKAPLQDGSDCMYVHMLRAGTDDTFCEDNILFDCRHKLDYDATENFNKLGRACLNECPHAKLIVMDEIGTMEEHACGFQEAIREKLNDSIPVIGVLRQDVSAFIDEIKSRDDVTIVEVTEENRDRLAGCNMIQDML